MACAAAAFRLLSKPFGQGKRACFTYTGAGVSRNSGYSLEAQLLLVTTPALAPPSLSRCARSSISCGAAVLAPAAAGNVPRLGSLQLTAATTLTVPCSATVEELPLPEQTLAPLTTTAHLMWLADTCPAP